MCVATAKKKYVGVVLGHCERFERSETRCYGRVEFFNGGQR